MAGETVPSLQSVRQAVAGGQATMDAPAPVVTPVVAPVTEPAGTPAGDPATPSPFDTQLSEHTKGKYKTWADIEKLESEYSAIKPEYERIKPDYEKIKSEYDTIRPEYETLKGATKEELHPSVQKMNEFIKSGGVVDNTWLRLQNTDFDKITEPYDLLSERLRYEKKGISQEEINVYLNENFKDFLSDEDNKGTEKHTALTKRLEREAGEAREFLKKHQSDTSVPSNAQDAAKQKAEQEQQQKTFAEQNKKAIDGWNAKVDEFSTKALTAPQKVSVTDTTTGADGKVVENELIALDFEIDKDVMKTASDFVKWTVTQPLESPVFNDVRTADGKIDMNKLLINKAKELSSEKILKTVVDQLKAEVTQAYENGKKGIVMELKNVKIKEKEHKGEEPVAQTEAESLKAGIIKHRQAAGVY